MKSVGVRSVFPDILSLLKQQASTLGNHPALEFAGSDPVSYRELHNRVVYIAQRLSQAGTQKPGQRPRIGIVLSNGPLMATALLGAAVAGVAMPFNPGYTLAEFEAYFKDTRPDFLLVDMNEQGPATVAAAATGLLVVRIRPDMTLSQIRFSGDSLPVPQPDDVALVLLTSGSTGRAKSVPLTHRNVCTSARDVSRSMALSSTDRCLAMWEQYHVGGLVDLLLAPLASGGTVICTKGFNAEEFYRLLGVAKPTWFQVVPTTLNDVVGHARRQGLNPRGSSLRLLRSVAAALSPRLMAEAEELFQIPVIATFGMTEAGPLITSTPLPPAVRKPGSVGKSCGCEIRIADMHGNTLPPGAEGQVAIRGDNVFPGYEGDAAANAAQFRDGWFFTGDLGRLDADGELTLTGRLKQLINRGGEKVNPQEVDDALLSHPAIAEAACFPVAHATLGEDVAAAVVLRGTAEVESIRRHLATLLAPFKIPARIQVLESLPRNAVGKVDRLALADTMAKADAQKKTVLAESGTLEAQVASIWAKELGLPSVGIDVEFSALGGDSLSEIKVLVAVETAVGRKMRNVGLRQSMTVRKMARLLEQEGEAIETQAVVDPSEFLPTEQRAIESVMLAQNTNSVNPEDRIELFPGTTVAMANRYGKKQAIFWCFNRPQFEFLKLAHELGSDYPIYGFYSGGKLFDNSEATIDKFVRYYTAQIQKIQPVGPYFIGGSCKGAWIASRVVVRLKAAGAVVNRVCLTDYSTDILQDYEGQQLLSFGLYSNRYGYREIGLTTTGFRVPFKSEPLLQWIPTNTAGIFQVPYVAQFAQVLRDFVDGTLVADRPNSLRTRFALFLHRSPRLYRTLFSFFKKRRDFIRAFRRSQLKLQQLLFGKDASSHTFVSTEDDTEEENN